MPTFILRQPDGKLAAFSSIVENFTAYDMTEAEAFEYCREDLDLGRAESERKVQAGLEDHEPWTIGVKGDGLSRWRDALSTMALNKTRATVTAILAEIGFPNEDISKLDFASEDF